MLDGVRFIVNQAVEMSLGRHAHKRKSAESPESEYIPADFR